MDPDYERRLIDEVIYLHSLWHQGPPTRPTQQPTPSGLLHHPYNPIQFKRQERIKPASRKGRQNSDRKQLQESQNPTLLPSPASGKEWPCNPTSNSPPATTSGWGTSWPQSSPQTLLPSSAEKAKLAASQAQFKALQITEEFFKSGDDDDKEDSEDDDDDDSPEEEEYRFFFKVFTEDRELREYYEKNYYNGEFNCLVCGGLGKKLAGKKFKDCVALVQHSISIAKTKKRRAHRAYGQVICKVLGWDLARLPTIVSALSEKRELCLQNSRQGDVEGQDKCKAQEKVCKGTEGSSVVHENQDSQMDASNSGQANVGKGTNDVSVSLETKEALVNVSKGGEYPPKECVCTEILPNNGGESADAKISSSGAEASDSPEVFCQTIPETLETTEAGLVNDG
ncbi:uncharacterized protein LOC113770419 isoform X1 [Coffea eugenioides]|uniref:uncharacterized protein LOC113770418 isoform X1 n=1 Tax=Coffea eugenioides TaxID=49369 RepID=UPI000F60B06C|nr:uncharacterized protein LOC113770418 isoform X1 [Coffea eugenioides]XP_027170664.1 uncharacterized protein LOC113770418 isoform X1 [Coffea eugenioides]XP_027170666.1 uncharacterized protein LOC113770419 isoform X1 [Coffea eugenioides]XP_027170667.1 uncharacterized protein LOC113770419 isoform X1 [Coffea eugenioides]